ncbi:MAG: tetratricopeptide repeat protein [Fibrobacter sp.]|nr:tetratricopeptide repeat protein [Fibrobacter sp.]
MMKAYKAIAISFIFFVLGAAQANPVCQGIAAGTKAYNEGNFERAIDEWQTCVDNDSQKSIENADLYYNLGNAYFRNGKLGYAIFYYKSALRLSPNNADIQHNLKYAESMTKDKVNEDGEENPLLSGLYKAHHALSIKTQLYILLALFWMIMLAAVGYKILISNRQKNIMVGSIFAFTALFCIVGASAGYKIFVNETEIIGVVTAKDADVTSAPNHKSQTLNTLSEGTSFMVHSEQGQFVEISLGEKIHGFVSKSEVGIIKSK